MVEISKLKKILFEAFKLMFYLAVTFALLLIIINSIVVLSTKNRIKDQDFSTDEKFDCILVLGAGVWNNSSPSHMLEDRLLVAINLYERNLSGKLLMSGDNGQEYYDEVNVMKNFAIEKGVPSSDIFMDHAGFSTYESVYRAKYIFQAENILIVTQKYHLPRALFIARGLGMNAIGVPADLRGYIGQSRRDIREFAARNKDFALTFLKPEPTFLGDIIPIDGDGDITNDR